MADFINHVLKSEFWLFVLLTIIYLLSIKPLLNPIPPDIFDSHIQIHSLSDQVFFSITKFFTLNVDLVITLLG